MSRVIRYFALPLKDYTYDANGNRLTASIEGIATAYAYETGSNQLGSIGSTAISKDAAGNIVNDGRYDYHYNAQNRLYQVH